MGGLGMKLSQHDIAKLKPYRFFDHTNPLVVKETFASVFNDERQALIELERVCEVMNAPDLKVAASIFMKRYAFLPVITLYSMTMLKKKLNPSIQNISFIDSFENDMWLPSIKFQSMSSIDMDTDYPHLREKLYRELFAQHIYGVMDTLSRVTKLSKLIMWENIGIYLFWLYESLLEENKDPMIHRLITEDFHFLLDDQNAKLFGPYNHNPLKRYFHEKRYFQQYDAHVRVRSTCCFSYRLDEKENRCKTCPQACKKLR